MIWSSNFASFGKAIDLPTISMLNATTCICGGQEISGQDRIVLTDTTPEDRKRWLSRWAAFLSRKVGVRSVRPTCYRLLAYLLGAPGVGILLATCAPLPCACV